MTVQARARDAHVTMRAIVTSVRSTLFAVLATLIICVPLTPRQSSPVTAADYARAERFLAPAVTPLVVGGNVAATWLPDDRFWYRNMSPPDPNSSSSIR